MTLRKTVTGCGQPVNIPDTNDVTFLHDTIVHQVGGAEGLRSRDALSSALGRIELRMQYDVEASVFDIAALTAVSVAKSHAFMDGNKRAAYGAMQMVLAMNGYIIQVDPAETMKMIVAAATDGDDVSLSIWLARCAVQDPVYQALFDYDKGFGPDGDL